MVALNGLELPPERRIESTTLLPVFKFHIKVTFSQVVIICLHFVHLTMDGRAVGPNWFGFFGPARPSMHLTLLDPVGVSRFV